MAEKLIKEESNWFDYLKIGLVSTERILGWSFGEVEKPETINYRTFKPERKGLFCEKIFGPVKDWECHCGRYRRVRYRGIICDRCGVEVTTSRVRRERMGHIRLCVPVSHVWFLRGIPGYIGLLLDISNKSLEEVIYYDSYIVTEASDDLKKTLEVGDVLKEGEYQDLKDKHGGAFKAETGAKPIKELLSNIDLPQLVKQLRKELKGAVGQKRIKVVKRLRVAEAFLNSGNRPEWMILEVLPVMPPDLRPMVQLEGGRFATSDLNDLYRRVLNRNNRLKKMIQMGAPEMIIRNEKRMLQEAVDVLIDNGRRKRAVTGSTGRPLKSLTDIIEGKQGRFRQNLLGKRADYSGRSVIVVGPSLKIYQCGLPKSMALELFKPFVISKLVEKGLSQNVKSAKRQLERKDVVVWDVLEEVIKGHVVLLNRAPTLHRLGIQAFEPILVEGKAIQLHPLVCTAFNADFDGDQMAVHVPLLPEAQVEARLLMLSSNNVLSPASGRAIIAPTQDVILGTYYLTFMDEAQMKGSHSAEGKFEGFSDMEEAVFAYDNDELHLHSVIKVAGVEGLTTVGRVIFNYNVNRVLKQTFADESVPYMNFSIDKGKVSQLVESCYKRFGSAVAANIADEIKRLGFMFATRAGISIGIDDLIIPDNKKEIITKAEKEIEQIEKMERHGSISPKEKLERVLDTWSTVTDDVTQSLMKQLEDQKLNSVYLMSFSGARGNKDQVRQLSGIRGLMADAQGHIIDIPIKTNFKEGLSVTEYFISSYGARKGLVDTALRTADSGYLTRRLVDVTQDIFITEEDCGTKHGIEVAAIMENYDVIVPLRARIFGRIAATKVVDPNTGKTIISSGDEIDEATADKIVAAGVEAVEVRSPLSCKAKRGICQKCYGRNLATGKLVNVGEAIGVIAAQSIGEPGTQLTMRTFHIGGVALRKSSRKVVKAKHAGKIKFTEDVITRTVIDDFGNKIKVLTKETVITVDAGKDRIDTYPMSIGYILRATDKAHIEAGGTLAEYEENYEYVTSKSDGRVKLINIEFAKKKAEATHQGQRVKNDDGMLFVYHSEAVKTYQVPKSTNIFVKVGDSVNIATDIAEGVTAKTPGVVIEIFESGGQKNIVTAKGEFYQSPSDTTVLVEDAEDVKSHDVLARVKIFDSSKTRDIIQGLPRVEELFEARKPKNAAILSEIDGKVDITDKEDYRKVTVAGEDDDVREYLMPYESRLAVAKGDRVTKGTPLTYGKIDPHEVLRIEGIGAVQTHLVNEVQRVYREQGVSIHDKHIETAVRQMTKKVRIMTPGDTMLLPGELIDRNEFEKVLEDVKGEKPTVSQVLLGITKASLMTDSFISAASFQETARILTDAAIRGKIDEMYGLKENVIIGKLIPAGTGFVGYKHFELQPKHGKEGDE